MSGKAACIRLNPADNCAVALENLKKGQSYPVGSRMVLCGQDIERGHKIALFDLSAGDPVIKCGYAIGRVTGPIREGCLIHISDIISFTENILNE